MHAQRFIETVTENGLLQLNVGKPKGARVEVIVLDYEESDPFEALHLAHLQERTAFAIDILANPAEDVWNEL
ncbi:MAG: hypothetical protein PHE55_15945 [Methylococcaceae bacterium]|nr:hypothetical protein [Methylococcaceae bacterium]